MGVLFILANEPKATCSESELLYQKKITTKIADILLVSQYEYKKFSGDKVDIYCISSEYFGIFDNQSEFNSLDNRKIVSTLQKNICKGIFVLVTKDKVVMGGALLDVSLSWRMCNDRLVISDSTATIALFLGLSISKATLALNLISSLPYYPFQNIPFWKGVNVISSFCVLEYNENEELRELKTWNPPPLDSDVEPIYQSIRERLLELIGKKMNHHTELSADLSGGVDSATIVYILKALQADVKLYHAVADSKWNHDSEWAKLISNDINHPVISLPSLGDTGRNFEVDIDYSNSILPDRPLFWADTEGYVEAIAKATMNPVEAIHFTGIGGDELFTPMPANTWSLVRQNKLRSVDLGLRYCLLSRTRIAIGTLELVNNYSFKKAIKLEIDKGFGYVKSFRQSSALNWSGPVNVPAWIKKPYREQSYKALINKLDDISSSLDEDRSRHQMIESLLFQRRLMNQLNKVYGANGMTWHAPFLDSEIVNYSLSIPVRYRQANNITKPTLYQATKGIVPLDIFTRGFKADYSTGLYKSYKKAADVYSQKIRDFELVKLGIVDADVLISELSMPTAMHSRIESFERIIAVERWLRIALYKMKK